MMLAGAVVWGIVIRLVIWVAIYVVLGLFLVDELGVPLVLYSVLIAVLAALSIINGISRGLAELDRATTRAVASLTSGHGAEAELTDLRRVLESDPDIESELAYLDATRDERVARSLAKDAAVREFVWQRDEGRCVRCAAVDDLHVVYVVSTARGGSENVIEDLHLLCEDCERRIDSGATP